MNEQFFSIFRGEVTNLGDTVCDQSHMINLIDLTFTAQGHEQKTVGELSGFTINIPRDIFMGSPKSITSTKAVKVKWYQYPS